MQTRTTDQARFDMILGQVIRDHREKRMMSRPEVTRMLGKTESILERIETGKASTNIYRIVQICDILGVNPGNIVDLVMYKVYTQKPTP